MNLNSILAKSMNLNSILAKSMNLNLKIKKKMNGSNPATCTQYWYRCTFFEKLSTTVQSNHTKIV